MMKTKKMRIIQEAAAWLLELQTHGADYRRCLEFLWWVTTSRTHVEQFLFAQVTDAELRAYFKEKSRDP